MARLYSRTKGSVMVRVNTIKSRVNEHADRSMQIIPSDYPHTPYSPLN